MNTPASIRPARRKITRAGGNSPMIGFSTVDLIRISYCLLSL